MTHKILDSDRSGRIPADRADELTSDNSGRMSERDTSVAHGQPADRVSTDYLILFSDG